MQTYLFNKNLYNIVTKSALKALYSKTFYFLCQLGPRLGSRKNAWLVLLEWIGMAGFI